MRLVRNTLAEVAGQLNRVYGTASSAAQQALRALNSVESLRRALHDSIRREQPDGEVTDCYFAPLDLRR